MANNIKCLKKSTTRHRTYPLSSSKSVIWCIRYTIPQVVLLVNLNANWSAIDSGGMAERSHFVTISFSAILDKIGVTETGLKSASCKGCEILGTGVTTACSHCSGTLPDLNEKFMTLTVSSANSTEQRQHKYKPNLASAVSFWTFSYCKQNKQCKRQLSMLNTQMLRWQNAAKLIQMSELLLKTPSYCLSQRYHY